MAHYEYKVIPAPSRGEKARGVKGAEARFAYALERLMNEMGRDGWEFQRAETLPSEERQGLTGTTTAFRHMLVFRRQREDALDAYQPRLLESPRDPEPEAADLPARPAPLPLTDPLPAVAAEAGPADAEPAQASAPAPAQPEPRVPSVLSLLRSRAASINGRKDDLAAE